MILSELSRTFAHFRALSRAQLVYIKSHVILDTWYSSDRSQHSFGRSLSKGFFDGSVLFGSEVVVNLKYTLLLTQT